MSLDVSVVARLVPSSAGPRHARCLAIGKRGELGGPAARQRSRVVTDHGFDVEISRSDPYLLDAVSSPHTRPCGPARRSSPRDTPIGSRFLVSCPPPIADSALHRQLPSRVRPFRRPT